MIFSSLKTNRAFTLVELLISLAIFAFMTAFLVAKYGNFNQGILLTNLAYDVALTLRNAQSYGLNVKSKPEVDAQGNITQVYSRDFGYPYGVHFTKNGTTMIFFADIDKGGDYDSNAGELISTYIIKNGSKISQLCSAAADNQCTSTPGGVLDITFFRPDPDAIIYTTNSHDSWARITIESKDGGIRNVIVNKTGQISVTN